MITDIEDILEHARIYKLTSRNGKGVCIVTIENGLIVKHFCVREDHLTIDNSNKQIEEMDEDVIQYWHKHHATQRITWFELLVLANLDKSHFREYAKQL